MRCLTLFPFEAVVLAGGHEVVLVAADGSLGCQYSVQGSDDVVVHVPGLDAQGLIAVHLGPRVGRFESRQIQQALVHDGQGIGHGPALFLADLQGKRFLRMQFVGQGQHTADAVQAQREVVGTLAAGLQQGYVDKEAGSQVGGDRNLHGRILVGRSAHPVARNHLVGVFDRYQGFPAGGGGQVSRDHLPAAAAFLVQREGQHGKHLRVAPVGPAVPVGPVDQYRVAGHVPAFLVIDHDQIPAPVFVEDLEREGGVRTGIVIDHDQIPAPVFVGGLEREGGVRTGRGNQFAFSYFLGTVSLDVGAQAGSLVFPPPRPFDLEDSIAQGPAGNSRSFPVTGLSGKRMPA